MICPKCRAEYREGFFVCSDCNINLVNELPTTERPDLALNFDETDLEVVFETPDSYQYLDACKVLKDARIPFVGDERYTAGEIQASRRAQAPYVWSILVPNEKREDALQLLEPMTFVRIAPLRTDIQQVNKSLAWILLAVLAAGMIFVVMVVRKL